MILDDFFFYNSKSDADIAAKGGRSWTQYRLEKMREVAQDLVLKPARAANPRVRVIIKYPNWYEHFQGLGYDLDVEAKYFDFIYTGTETRDPEITDQLLQQYQSYLVFRYFDNVRPQGGNRGGWVDTYDTRYVDRYAEQLWDTLFARAPEITLFNWSDLASAAALVPARATGLERTAHQLRLGCDAALERRRIGARRGTRLGRAPPAGRSSRRTGSSAGSAIRSASQATSRTSPAARTICRRIWAISVSRSR